MLNFSNGTLPHLAALLVQQEPIHIGEWQSKDTSRIPQMATYEVTDMTFMIDVPETTEQLVTMLGEDLNHAWAEEHFQERVGGVPVNPPPSHERWPWSRHNESHQNGVKHEFAHTYPERMWPKQANRPGLNGEHQGIRFAYGDLDDVVNLLVRSPLTRQAFLPIWFPEDTGAHHRQRVPCTLGYHFMIRHGALTMRYYMRSCDLVRHFTDDIYLAARLMQWVREQWQERVTLKAMAERPEVRDWEAPPLAMGRLTMYVASLHAFTGDEYKLHQMIKRVSDVADQSPR